MDVKWLQDFLTVAELGNFTRAAETLNSSQTALSRRIQSLEAWLGARLIDRSVFPTRLTPEGEQFRHSAAEILRQVIDARSDLSGAPARDHVRVALPYTLATSGLPRWWEDWSRDRNLSCSVVVGNVHDMMTALVAGSVDLLVCYNTSQQPIQLDAAYYNRSALCTESLRPYASPKLLGGRPSLLPGRPDDPVPLLMYSPGVYFGRLVKFILQTMPVRIHARLVVESDMVDVLREMAAAGYGVAWLPDGTIAADAGSSLVPLGDEALSLTLTTTAFCNRSNDRPAVVRLWERLTSMAEADLRDLERRNAGAHPR